MRAAKAVVEGGDITVNGGGSFIRIDASGVTIQGPVVTINEGGSPGSYAHAKFEKPLDPQQAAPMHAGAATKVVVVDRDGQEITGVVTVVVGEQVVLELRASSPNSIATATWALDPEVDAVEGHILKGSHAKVIHPGSPELSRYTFYWVVGGKKQARALQVKVDGVPVDPPPGVIFEVQEPSNVDVGWEIGGKVALRKEPGALWLAFGDDVAPSGSVDPRGIIFKFKATTAKVADGGEIAGFQRLQTTRRAVDDKGVVWTKSSPAGEWWCDSDRGDGAYESRRDCMPHGEWRIGGVLPGDSPAEPIEVPPGEPKPPAFTEMSLSYRFEMFFMYRPVWSDKRGSMFVTLRKLRWDLVMSAKHDGTEWKLVPPGPFQPDPSNTKGSVNPTLTSTAELPEWSQAKPDPWRWK